MPVLALLIIVAVALVIVRIGATALMMTGLSRDVAEFQAVSCFFGVGFTTSESEMIVSHPARRKIASQLIISGNIGLTGALSTVIITFVQPGADGILPSTGASAFFLKLAVILFGIIVVGLIFRIRFVKRILEALIKISLKKIHKVRAIDYETVLRSKDGFAVMQFEIEKDHPLSGRTLAGAQLSQVGVLVLGIERASGQYIGATHSTTEIQTGDVLTVYGHECDIVSALER